MGIENGEYVIPSVDSVFESQALDLLSVQPNANPSSDGTYTYALLQSVAETLVREQEQSLKNTYEASFIRQTSDEELTQKAENLGFIRKDAIKATGVVTFSRESNATTDYTIPEGTVVETLESDPVQFETTETVTLSSGTKSVTANIEAIEAGSAGNVGPNSIQAIPSPPTGVGSVNNANPTGDATLTDTNGDPLVTGRDRESDSELRSRVLETDATGEGPSPDGIKLALQQTEDVVSVDLNVNATSSTVDGLDPYTTEIVVFGGEMTDIADTILATMSVTTVKRLQGGVNGTKEERTETIDLLDEDVTIPISRPIKDDLDLEIDVVHTANYEGTDAAKDAVVSYVGGTFTDGATNNGLLIGEDVLVNEIENRIEDVTGVDYADVTLLDVDGDNTDDTTTTANGVPIYNVGDSSLARVDTANITLSETQVS